MAGKIFLFSFLSLLITTEVFAVPTCDGKDETNCKATAGCEWNPNLPPDYQCKLCNAGSYCENGNPTECPSNFSNSAVGAGSIGECYKKLSCDNNGTIIQNCRYYQGSYTSGLNVVFLQNDTTTPTAHLEGGLDGTCYTNTRKCEKFNSTGCDGDVGSGNASYSPEPGIQRWSIGTCKCTETGVNYTQKNCIATKNYTASGTITTVATGITYTMSTYYCTGCIAGHYVTPNDITPQSQCMAPSGNINVCSCTQVNQGYYMSQCNWNYPLNAQPTNCVSPQKCPAGQTTNGPGATSSDACHYGDETKLCDSTRECILLKDVLDGVSANQWSPYNN